MPLELQMKRETTPIGRVLDAASDAVNKKLVPTLFASFDLAQRGVEEFSDFAQESLEELEEFARELVEEDG